jgi:23S rRNA (guanine1835-N2)-methyltransferase
VENPQYELKLESRTPEGSKIYSFSSADGVPSKNSFRDAELALADYVGAEPNDNILVVQSGYGFLGAVFGDKASDGRTVLAETSDRAYQLSQNNIEENSVDNASCRKVAYYREINKEFDKIIYAPHSYEPVDLVKYRLGNLTELLDSGEIFIAGGKKDGIRRYESYLNEYGEVEKIAQDGGQRVYRYTSEDAYVELPEIETSFTAEMYDIELEFTSCKGLFSPNELDEGSRLLLENLEVEESEKVLDLACGYGIIGTFLKKEYNCSIFLSDDSKLATYYAEKNLEDSGIDEYKLVNRDCLDGFEDEKFDVIVSNPPTHQGKGVTDEMFRKSHQALHRGGELYLVYNKNMKFEKQLDKKFSDTEVLAEKDNFRVLKAVK